LNYRKISNYVSEKWKEILILLLCIPIPAYFFLKKGIFQVTIFIYAIYSIIIFDYETFIYAIAGLLFIYGNFFILLIFIYFLIKKRISINIAFFSCLFFLFIGYAVFFYGVDKTARILGIG